MLLTPSPSCEAALPAAKGQVCTLHCSARSPPQSSLCPRVQNTERAPRSPPLLLQTHPVRGQNSPSSVQQHPATSPRAQPGKGRHQFSSKPQAAKSEAHQSFGVGIINHHGHVLQLITETIRVSVLFSAPRGVRKLLACSSPPVWSRALQPRARSEAGGT